MPDNVPEDVKIERLNRMIALQGELSLESNRRDIGSIVEVLVEGVAKRSTAQMVAAQQPEQGRGVRPRRCPCGLAGEGPRCRRHRGNPSGRTCLKQPRVFRNKFAYIRSLPISISHHEKESPHHSCSCAFCIAASAQDIFDNPDRGARLGVRLGLDIATSTDFDYGSFKIGVLNAERDSPQVPWHTT